MNGMVVIKGLENGYVIEHTQYKDPNGRFQYAHREWIAINKAQVLDILRDKVFASDAAPDAVGVDTNG